MANISVSDFIYVLATNGKVTPKDRKFILGKEDLPTWRNKGRIADKSKTDKVESVEEK
jgi:hypothetical protein